MQDPPPDNPAAMELLDDDEEQQPDGQANEDQPEPAPAADLPARRYPARVHRVPDRYGPYIQF